MYKRILVPVDGSDTATRGLKEAVAMARLTGATVRVVHVIDQMSHLSGFESYSAYSGYIVVHLRARGEAILDNACAIVRQAAVPVERKLYETGGSRLAEVVLEDARAWAADLIVLGTHGRSGVDRFFFGSGAEEISRKASMRMGDGACDEAGAQEDIATTAAPAAAHVE
jgi:nucleotide-binding universal stress UspA family protein